MYHPNVLGGRTSSVRVTGQTRNGKMARSDLTIKRLPGEQARQVYVSDQLYRGLKASTLKLLISVTSCTVPLPATTLATRLSCFNVWACRVAYQLYSCARVGRRWPSMMNCQRKSFSIIGRLLPGALSGQGDTYRAAR